MFNNSNSKKYFIENISSTKIIQGKLIDKGGFGKVYKGTWNNQTVAIKQIKPLIKKNLIDFRRESEILAQCNSSNIVKLYGISAEPDNYSIIMEYCDNGSLSSLLDNYKISLSWRPFRWNITEGIVKGVAYLHKNGIIHNDLKSDNILLTNNIEPKICDFGFAVYSNSIPSKDWHRKGTIRWKAPESFKFKAVPSFSADIYSLGMVMWEIATRKFPYAMYENKEVIEKITNGVKEEIPSDCNSAYASIIQACWSDPADRPTIETVLEQLICAESSWFFEDEPEEAHVFIKLALGGNYEQGRGVDVNYEKASFWYQKAAELGNEEAINNLKQLQEKNPVNNNTNQGKIDGSNIAYKNVNLESENCLRNTI